MRWRRLGQEINRDIPIPPPAARPTPPWEAEVPVGHQQPRCWWPLPEGGIGYTIHPGWRPGPNGKLERYEMDEQERADFEAAMRPKQKEVFGIPVADVWRGLIKANDVLVTVEDIRRAMPSSDWRRRNILSPYEMASKLATAAFESATGRKPTIVSCKVEFDRVEGVLLESAFVFSMEAS